MLRKKNHKNIFKTLALRSNKSYRIIDIVKNIEKLLKIKFYINWKTGNIKSQIFNSSFKVLPNSKLKKFNLGLIV